MNESPTIVDALAMWNAWHRDQGPFGETGDYALNRKIGDAFRALIYRPRRVDQLAWIEREVSDPNEQRTGDPYRAELLRWWLDLFESERSRAAA